MAEVFVFGSNLAGRHGKGAAVHARKNFGAEYGVGEGRTGQSYALPTKDANLRVLSINSVRENIVRFLEYAEKTPVDRFHVTPIGCGLAGYSKHEIAAIFYSLSIPRNVVFTKEWMEPS